MNLFAYSLNLRPFDLAVKARAVRVLHENGQVVGVEVMNPERNRFFSNPRTWSYRQGRLKPRNYYFIQESRKRYWSLSHQSFIYNGAWRFEQGIFLLIWRL